MTKPKKKPTTTVAKKPTKRDAEILYLFQHVAGLEDRIDCQSRDIGGLVKRANGVDAILSANAQTHRGEISEMQRRLDSLMAGQFAQGCRLAELQPKADDTQKNGSSPEPPTLDEETPIIYRVDRFCGGFAYVLSTSPHEAARKLAALCVEFSLSSLQPISNLGDQIIR